MRALLRPLANSQDANSRQMRTANELIARMQAIEEGLDGLGPDATARDRARSTDPMGEVFAGAVRLAPADPLPWPFLRSEVPAPSIFSPLELIPEEWQDEADDRVFGWHIHG
jgi:hypothetical protein